MCPHLPVFAVYSDVRESQPVLVHSASFLPLALGMWTIPSMTCFRWWGMPTDLCRMTRGVASSCARAPKRSVLAFVPSGGPGPQNTGFHLVMEVLVSLHSSCNLLLFFSVLLCNKPFSHRELGSLLFLFFFFWLLLRSSSSG